MGKGRIQIQGQILGQCRFFGQGQILGQGLILGQGHTFSQGHVQGRGVRDCIWRCQMVNVCVCGLCRQCSWRHYRIN